MEPIQTQRLTLRAFAPADWEDLHEYLSDPEVVRYEPYETFSHKEALQEAASRAKNPDFWAVCLEDSGKLIGNVYLAKQDFDTWEIGYVFNRSYQGKGYATEACRALLDRVFRQWGGHRAVAMCNPENAASWRLLERLGFRREGFLLQNIFFTRDADGRPRWQDTFCYGLLAEEWAARE